MTRKHATLHRIATGPGSSPIVTVVSVTVTLTVVILIYWICVA